MTKKGSDGPKKPIWQDLEEMLGQEKQSREYVLLERFNKSLEAYYKAMAARECLDWQRRHFHNLESDRQEIIGSD